MYRILLFFPVLFAGLFLQVSAVYAESSLELTADSQLNYANHCFDTGDYTTAAAEYKRFMYFFPDDSRIDMADFKIGMCYFHEKSFTAALNHFTGILDRKGIKGTAIDSAFMISNCYQRLGNYPAAIKNLNYLLRLSSDMDLKDKIHVHLGWLYLESGDRVGACRAFSVIRPENQSDYHISDLNSDLNSYTEIQRKNPLTAGLLSIIPGGGYLYCGRYRDALTAFLINGVLIFGAYESFDKELYAIGGIMAAAETGFYAGSIYGGISSAYKYNHTKQNEFIMNLKKKFPQDLSVNIGPQSIMLGMSFQF